MTVIITNGISLSMYLALAHILEDLGNKISNINGERRSKSFLFQSIGIAIQRDNASYVMGTTGSMEKLEEFNYL